MPAATLSSNSPAAIIASPVSMPSSSNATSNRPSDRHAGQRPCRSSSCMVARSGTVLMRALLLQR